MSGAFNPRQHITNFANENLDSTTLQFIRDDPDGVDIQPIDGHGMVNYLYRVRSRDCEVSAIIKYAEETMKLAPDEKVSLERQMLEYNCLALMQTVQKEGAPEPYCLDTKYNILAMSDMSDWQLLGSELEKGHVNLEAATHLGNLLGKLHRETSRDNVTEERWQDLIKKFRREDLKEYIRLFSLDRPLDETDPIIKIPERFLPTFLMYVKEIKDGGLLKKQNDLYAEEICFIHGDCHCKSIFTKDGRTALFDFEFAFLGHPLYNVAFPVACYLFRYGLLERHGPQNATVRHAEDLKGLFIQAIRNLVEGYLEVQKEITSTEDDKRSFFSHLTIFTGSLLFLLGGFVTLEMHAKVHDDDDRIKILETGFTLMKKHEEVKTHLQFMEAISVAVHNQ